ncbi:MAG: hydroxymethylbilane synthase [Bacteroidota bacterium]
MHISIGTRGSKLALWQAYQVEKTLQAGGLETQIQVIETKGDKILNRALSKIGSKGVFTEELETQLRDGRIDLAVHSAKDLPSSLPDDLEILAFSEREKPHDVIVSYNPDFQLNNPEKPLIIGTSSTRRAALIRHFYPHLQLKDVRGNLQTRMQKLKAGQYQALVLAYAGVHRMEYDPYIVHHLPLEQFTPPVGQGSLAIEICQSLAEDKQKRIKELLNHSPTETLLRIERQFLRTLEGGCSIPVFAYAQWQGEQVHLNTGIISLDGQDLLRETRRSAHPAEWTQLGKTCAETLLARGGQAILQRIREEQ